MKSLFSFPKKTEAAQSNKGFIVVYAIIIGTILVAASTSIFSITLKELQLSRFGEASTQAFFVSEAGAECAMYWVIRGAFSDFGPAWGDDIECNGQTFAVASDMSDGDNTAEFTVRYNEPNGFCVDVLVFLDPVTKSGVVQARGYNTCDTASSFRTERAVEIDFVDPYASIREDFGP